MNLIIGSNSRLAKGLINYDKNNQYIKLKRDVYKNWWQHQSEEIIYDFLKKSKTRISKIYIMAAILDPKLPYTMHKKVNFKIPVNIIKAANRLKIYVITFGTIMENFYHKEVNSYIKSKFFLGRWVAKYSRSKKNVLHIQLHTLYGIGKPSKHMFIGQILECLQENKIFKMSSGDQVREYHHIEDVCKAVKIITHLNNFGLIQLNHGESIKLKCMARSIFKYFQRDNLLLIDKINNPKIDNYFTKFNKNIYLKEVIFRSSVISIIKYLEIDLQVKIRS